MGVIDWVKDKFSGDEIPADAPLTREVGEMIATSERQPEPEPEPESIPEPVPISDFPEFTEDLTEKITGNSKQEKYEMPWTSDVKEPETIVSETFEMPEPVITEYKDEERIRFTGKKKKRSDDVDISSEPFVTTVSERPDVWARPDITEIPDYGKNLQSKISRPAFASVKDTRKQKIPVVDLTPLMKEPEEAVWTEKEVKKEETKFNFSNLVPAAGTIKTPDLVSIDVKTPDLVPPIIAPFDPTIEGALRAGRIDPESAKNTFMTQGKGMSEEEATKKVKEITDDLAQKGGAEKFITLVDPLAKGPEVKQEPSKTTKWLKEKWEIGKGNILGTPAGDIDYAIRGGYTGASKESLEEDIRSLHGNTETLKKQLADLNEQIREEMLKRDKARERWESFRGSAKEKSELRDIVNDYDRDIRSLEKKRDAIIERIRENNEMVSKRRKAIDDYERAKIKGKQLGGFTTKYGKKLQALGEGASTVTSGLYAGKMGTGDWFGSKGFMKYPFVDKNVRQNVVSAPGLQNLSYITRSTGSKVGRDLAEGITTIRADKRIEPMGMPGTVYGARAKFDYGIPARRISLLDAAGGTLRKDIFAAQQPASQEVPQQYKQVIQPDGSIVNVPVTAVAHYRTPKSMITLVKRGVKSSVKPVQYSGMLKRGMNNVGSFKPVTFSSHMAASFRQVGKPTVIRQREEKLLDVSVNRYPRETLITNQPVGLDRFAKGFKSVNIVNKSVKILPEVRKVFDLGLISVKDMNIYETGDVIKHGQLKDIEYTETPIRERDRKPKKSSPLVNMKSLLRVGKKMNKFLSKQKVRK